MYWAKSVEKVHLVFIKPALKYSQFEMLSPLALSHVHSPRNCEPLAGASHYGQAGIPGDGPYVQLWLNVEEGVIKRTGYQCAGCFSSIACASMTAEVLIGRTLEQASKLEPSDLILLLQGLPEGKEDCADRTICAVKDALAHELGDDH